MDRIIINPKFKLILGLGLSAIIALILLIKKSRRRKNPWFRPSEQSDSANESSSPLEEQSFPTISSLQSSSLSRTSLLNIILHIKEQLTPTILRTSHRNQRRQIASETEYAEFVTNSIEEEYKIIESIQNSVLASLGVENSVFCKALVKYRHDEEVRRCLNIEEPESEPDLETCLHINQTLKHYFTTQKPYKPELLRAELEDLVWRAHGVELMDAVYIAEKYGNMIHIVRGGDYMSKETEFY